MVKKTIIVFTDGSCINNGKPNAMGGYGVHFPNNELTKISEKFTLKPITNQRAELYAIYIALKEICENLEFDDILIYSDSKYSIDTITKYINKPLLANGKPRKNYDIIMLIKNMINNINKPIKFKHVYSHKNQDTFESINNDIADKLAIMGTFKDN